MSSIRHIQPPGRLNDHPKGPVLDGVPAVLTGPQPRWEPVQGLFSAFLGLGSVGLARRAPIAVCLGWQRVAHQAPDHIETGVALEPAVHVD